MLFRPWSLDVCGFIALFQDKPIYDVDVARTASIRMAHRGPDACGEWREKDIWLFHRRLSIIDLKTGYQPMESHDRRYVVAFNGEIYNFLELRRLLEREGAVFRTESDTEILLEGYRHWGVDVVYHLNGMFAFVIWDRMEKVVFGARDRVGIKPLSWTCRDGALIVTSTLESLGALNGFTQIDPVAVRDLMTFDYIPSPRTIFHDVYKLEPGRRFQWRIGMGKPSIDCYWKPPSAHLSARSPDEFELEALLEQAVKRQMVSDVPIGAFLSGGIDSSLIVALMARQSQKPVRSFSIAFRDAAADESSIAGLVARQFGTDHTVLPAEDLGSEMLLTVLGQLDEPFADPALVPTYALSKMTAGYVKVALSGDGGDEVFGGYPKYLWREGRHSRFPGHRAFERMLCALSWRPRGMAHLYWRMLPPRDLFRWSWVRYGDFPVFRKDLRQVLSFDCYQAAEVSDYFEPWERVAKRYGPHIDTDVLMRADLETYLSENCLVKTDRASMLASLEVRVPYLDETVIDRIVPLHADQKIVGGQLKSLLIPIARRILPRQVWDRPKHGFDVPLDRFLAQQWRVALETALDWGEAHLSCLDYRYLRRLHRLNLSQGGIGRELWNPFVLLAWSMARSVHL